MTADTNPCPFCLDGGKPQVVEYATLYVRCGVCGAEARLSVWNKSSTIPFCYVLRHERIGYFFIRQRDAVQGLHTMRARRFYGNVNAARRFYTIEEAKREASAGEIVERVELRKLYHA